MELSINHRWGSILLTYYSFVTDVSSVSTVHIVGLSKYVIDQGRLTMWDTVHCTPGYQLATASYIFMEDQGSVFII